MKKSNIEILRFIFTIMIALHHFYIYKIGWLEKGYIAVEFFFILSGYLLINSCERNSSTNAGEYTLHKIVRFYPHYFFSFFIMSCVIVIEEFMNHEVTFGGLAKMTIESLPEILMIQNIGIYGGGNNYPVWYFSVLIVGGHILYFLINKYESLMINFILPIVVMMGCTYIFLGNNVDMWASVNGIYIPFVRGIVDMSIGVISYKIGKKFINIKSWCFDFLYMICICLIIMLFATKEYYDNYFLIVFATMIICGFHDNIWLEKISKKIQRIVQRLSEIAFPIFLNHAAIIKIFDMIIRKSGWQVDAKIIVIYLIVLLLYSSFTYWLVKKITKILQQKIKIRI